MTLHTPYLIFRVQNYRIALATDFISEVTRMIALEPFPGQDPCLRGLFSLRGTSVYTFDLQPLFSLQEVPFGPEARIITVRTGSGLFGIMAHLVEGMALFPASEARRSVDLPALIDVPGLREVFDTKDGFVLSFDPIRFFSRQPVWQHTMGSSQITMFEETRGA